MSRNRDPIYAPDGKTWYELALAEPEKRGNAEAEVARLRSELDQARRMVERMTTRINEIKETYEWCSEDPHDRGYSALDDAIRSAVASTNGQRSDP